MINMDIVQEFNDYMTKHNIVVSQVHARKDKHSCTKSAVINNTEKLVNLDILENEIISIPSGYWITKEQKEYIVKCIKQFNNN